MKIRPVVCVKFAFAAITLVVLFRFVPLTDIAAVLGGASAAWFALGVLLQFLVRAAATLRMQVIAANQGMSLGLCQLYGILLTTQFYSLFLPTPLAAGGVAWMKYLQHGAGKGAAAAAVVINRAIGLGMTIALGVSAWAIDRYGDQPVLAAAIVSPTIVALGVVILLPPQRIEIAQPGVDRPGRLQRLEQLLHRLLLFRRLSRSAKSVALVSTLAQELLGAAAILCFAIAVGAEVTLLSVIWIGAAVSTILLLPITVAGLGVREVSLVGLGAIVGIAASTAMAWSFMILAGVVVVAAVGGLVEANSAGRRVAAHLEKNRSRTVGGRAE